MKYRSWLYEWLENYVRPTLKRRTYVRYGEIVRGHILPVLGEAELEELTPLTLQHFIAELLKSGNLKTGEGLSPNSVNAVVTVMQNSLRAAYTFGFIKEYTADKIKRPKIREKKVSCFLPIEQKQLEDYIIRAEKSRFFGIILSLYTGLRIGELLALEWSDVDFKRGELQVNKTCYEGKNDEKKYVRMTDFPKTLSSVRVIPLPRQLISALRENKKKSRSIYVISNGENPVSVRSYQKSFELILKKLRIPHRGFHALRHTFATRALECGMDVKTLSELLGHKSPAVTLERYVHSLPGHKREMMNKMGKLFEERQRVR